MRVVFLEDVSGVAQGGDIKEVKNGFARNYLIPQRLAMPVSREALQRVQRLTKQAESKRLKLLTDMRALGETLDGTRIDIEMKAGASGRLYGSVTGAIVAEHLSQLIEQEIDRRTVEIPEPIRQTGRHDLSLRLHSEVEANISVLVYPSGSDPAELLAAIEAKEADQEKPGEDMADLGAYDEMLEEPEATIAEDVDEAEEPEASEEPAVAEVSAAEDEEAPQDAATDAADLGKGEQTSEK
jgi:large subunit ribosomal protein L9